MDRSTPLLAIVAVALFLAGCTGAAAGNGGQDLAEADAVVVAEDVAFAEIPESVDAGTIRLGLDNRGFAPHDLTIEGLGTVAEAGGRSTDLTEVELEPGSYTVWCDVPGHREAGMEFLLQVR